MVVSPVRVALGTIFRRDAVTMRSDDERTQRRHLTNITAIFHISHTTVAKILANAFPHMERLGVRDRSCGNRMPVFTDSTRLGLARLHFAFTLLKLKLN